MLLFSHTNPKLSNLAREKGASGCNKYLLFADVLYKSSGSLIEQSGGLNENGEVLVPYRKGRLALEILENNDTNIFGRFSGPINTVNRSGGRLSPIAPLFHSG